MDLLYHSIFLEHDTGAHPENKTRLYGFQHMVSEEIKDGASFLPLVHSHEYINQVAVASENGLSLDQDTVTSRRSFEVACHGVALTLKAAASNNFALVRPPGHHAYPTYGSGFCLFNNIAIAVKHLVSQHKRVLILDFDGHCGDGTEHIFYDSNQVLFWSLHQSPAFPGKGFIHDIGENAGLGYTINVELPPGTADDLFFQGIERILPIAKKFKPDVVAVSAGFDAHQADPLLQLKLSMNSYYELGQILTSNFQNVFAVLEGGYNIEVLSKCIHNFVDGINGVAQKYTESSTKSTTAADQVFKVKLDELENNLADFW